MLFKSLADSYGLVVAVVLNIHSFFILHIKNLSITKMQTLKHQQLFYNLNSNKVIN